MDRPSEFDLIAQLFAPLATAPGALGLTDDAALIAPPVGHEMVITTDALVEGVHFLATDPPQSIARKALRVNLSDLAAKGAVPAGYLLALSLPARLDFDWLKNFAHGLALDGAEFSLPLLGGDTTSTPGPLTIAITALGFVPKGAMPRRGGAKPGDYVYVTGTIGDAGAGLELLLGATAPRRSAAPEDAAYGVRQLDADNDAALYLIDRYRVPTPRLAQGLALRDVVTASLDVSDGLIADLGHIADVSHVKIVVDAGLIPLSPALRRVWGAGEDAVLRAATAGDDYEIAFTAGPLDAAAFGVCRIGRVSEGAGVFLMGSAGEIAVSRAGYRHF
ncbi:MAG: thiamine-phosphate kinase [Rhizomicrobium sp.]